MIKNERQYRITKAEAARFAEALAALDNPPSGEVSGKAPTGEALHPLLVKAQRDALQSQYDELLEELSAYEALRSGEREAFALHSLDMLPAALIQARIAAQMTQRDLARRVRLKEQQIQRYEAQNYQTASLKRLKRIADALGVDLEGHLVSTK